jgi:zinc/manganese transport system substrate-binding protein
VRTSTVAIAAAISLAAALPLAGCSSAGSSSPESSTTAVSVVATTTILGDVVGDIVACADPEGTVTTLMPIGADPHDFSPSSAQVAQIVTADVVVANGLGLESGLTDALANAAADGATIINVAELVDPIPFGEHADDHADEGTGAEDGHGDGDADPHVWFDMGRMATAAQLIGDELAASGDTAFASCGSQVADDIRAAEVEVRATLESVPADRRILVTDHDALGYLADAYGYTIAGTVIPAGTTLAEPSSAELSDLVSVIQTEEVPAIFANTSDSTALSDAVAAEVGTQVQVVQLYVGSLGEPGSGADTYISMMETNASLIANALNS